MIVYVMLSSDDDYAFLLCRLLVVGLIQKNLKLQTPPNLLSKEYN